MTRGCVNQRGEVMISSVGVSTVPTGLLLRPESVLTDVVVELLHAQSAAGASVGACKGTHQLTFTSVKPSGLGQWISWF